MDTADIPKTVPTPWFPETNLVRCGVLGKSVEELGELITIIGRIQIQGIDGKDPKTGKPNKQALSEEVGDVLARCQKLIQQFELDSLVISSRAEAKFNFLNRWLELLAEDHDGWYPMGKVNMPREVINGEMMVDLWLQPSDALDDISKGVYARNSFWSPITPPRTLNVPLELEDAQHWVCVPPHAMSDDDLHRFSVANRATHWRYANNDPVSTPTLVTA